MPVENPGNYLIGWRFETYQNEPKDKPAISAASNQYDRIKKRDIVWIVTVRRGELFLIARIEVAECIDHVEAQRRFGRAWEATYHIIARPGSEEPLRKINITAFAHEFRFDGSASRLPEDFRQSFRRLRRLTTETADLLQAVWIKDSNRTILREQQHLLEEQGVFDGTSDYDARVRVLAEIVRRQGQQDFRRRLLEAYGGRCAVTDCDVEDSLEAAHLEPYRGEHTHITPNGILLRADIHTLFDLNMLTIDPVTLTVVLSPRLRSSHYGPLHGRRIAIPVEPEDRPSESALRRHYANCLFTRTGEERKACVTFSYTAARRSSGYPEYAPTPRLQKRLLVETASQLAGNRKRKREN